MPKCNHCGSIKTRKISAIYEEQTSISYESGTIKGVNFRGRFTNETIVQTNLARQIAPPTVPKGRKLEIILSAAAGFSVAMIVGIFLKSVLLIRLAFWIAIAWAIYALYCDFKDVAQSKKRYQKQNGAWNKSYRCSDCGHIFIPKNSN
ncbi:MAG: hypothetical protein AB4426_19700 [Xenococcaceae cyanobacterium]